MKRDIPVRKIDKALAQYGFYTVSTNGGHQKYRHADGRTAAIPFHRIIKGSTILTLIKTAKLPKEDFLALL